MPRAGGRQEAFEKPAQPTPLMRKPKVLGPGIWEISSQRFHWSDIHGCVSGTDCRLVRAPSVASQPSGRHQKLDRLPDWGSEIL